MNRTERRQQAKADEKLLARGIDPAAQDAEPIAAMARLTSDLLETAKAEKNLYPAIRFLHAKVEATLEDTRKLPIACGKGCAHCCHSWVSAPAMEIIHVAKTIRRREGEAAIARVRAAHAATRAYDVVERKRHPQACPLLVENICTFYEVRPMACRFAASASAEVCERAFLQASGEAIPSPVRNLNGRGAYQIALGLALRHAGLPHHYYEFNAGLTRALEREDCEEAWLSGEDVFHDVKRDPTDIFSHPQAQLIYRQAFGAAP